MRALGRITSRRSTSFALSVERAGLANEDFGPTLEAVAERVGELAAQGARVSSIGVLLSPEGALVATRKQMCEHVRAQALGRLAGFFERIPPKDHCSVIVVGNEPLALYLPRDPTKSPRVVTDRKPKRRRFFAGAR